MPLDLGTHVCPLPGVQLLVEVSIPSALSGFGVWDSARWDVATWGPDDVWEDVSEYVRSVRTDRKFGDDWRTWRAGTATVVLNNVDGRFSPANTTGPYASLGVTRILPSRRIRISLLHGGNTHIIFYGKTLKWEEVFVLYGPRFGDASVSISATDVWSELALAKPLAVSPVGDGETFGPRIIRILNAAEFTGPTAIDVGTISLQETDLSSNPVEEIIDTAASEGGIVYAEADGSIVGLDKDALLTHPRSTTVQIAWGDGPGETPWSETPTYAALESTNMVNMAAYTCVGGTQQVYRDEESIALYGVHADQSSWVDRLLCKYDSDVLDLAVWATMRTIPQDYFSSLRMHLFCNPSLVSDLISSQMWDLHEITLRPPSAYSHVINRQCFVVGIEWVIENGDAHITFTYAPAGAYMTYSGSRWDSAIWGASADDPLGSRFFA